MDAATTARDALKAQLDATTRAGTDDEWHAASLEHQTATAEVRNTTMVLDQQMKAQQAALMQDEDAMMEYKAAKEKVHLFKPKRQTN